MAFVPASLLTLGAGAIFGVVWGVIYVFVAATIGAGLSFLVARYVARAAVEKRLATNEKIIAVDRAVAAEGRKIVFLLRLVPIIPFNALNYGLGLTRVSFADYLVGSIGMIPATLMYVYSGKVAGDVAELASGASVSQGAGYYAFLGLGLAATIAVTVVVTRIARRALAEATGE
ncbi:MAG: TVP38/TMEM64 family protein [Myxococcota bacterium]